MAMDPLKQLVVDAVMRNVKNIDGTKFRLQDGVETERAEVSQVDGLNLQIRVKFSDPDQRGLGPRYFSVRVSENW